MTGNRPPTRQMPLDLAHRAAQSRDDLIVTPANARAVALVDGWPDWPTPVAVLVGPAGSGKSHLATIWRGESGAGELPPDAIGAQAADTVSRGPVLVEDADGSRLDEEGLFHLINAAAAARTHVLLSARRLPAAWGVGLADLLSRLRAASTVEIEPPDDLLLAGVITKLFADRQVEVEPHVVQFLVRRIERSLSTAMRVVERLDRAALERKVRISRALAAEIVGALDAGQGDLGI